MSESERDQIDTDAQEIIKSCRDTIVVFRQEADRQKVQPQVREHRHAAIIMVEAYLKGQRKVLTYLKHITANTMPTDHSQDKR